MNNQEQVTYAIRCKVCGAPLYRTDSGGRTVTLQCSSLEAQFWNFPRGSKQNETAHRHFEDSTQTVMLDIFNKYLTYQ